MSQTTFLIVAGVSLALLAASGNIDGFRARPRMPQRVLSQAELQLFTTTRATGEIVMAGSSGVIIDQGFQAVRVGTDAITFLAGSTADTEVVRIGTNGNVGIGTTNSSTNKLTVQGAARLNGTSAALELNDGNSGLTYSSSTNAFVGTGTSAKPSNGPVLFGQTDGALGVKGGGQANALYWNSTGVGIKNNAPAYALDVTGSVHATSDAVFDSNVGIGNSAPAYKLDVTGGVHATSNAIFDSKVGIGTSAPGASYALDVTGGVHATSNAIFDSKVGIGTSAPGASYALDVTGGVHATSNAIFDSKVGIGNAAPGANYALDVTGNVNFTGSLYQGGSLFKTSQWTTTGSDIIYTAGKIGIGVTAPTAAIHVASGSDINLSNALVVKNTSTTTLAASASLGLTFASLNDNVTNGRTSYDPSYVLFTVDNTLPGPSTTWASTGAVPFAANSVFVVNITLSSTDSFPPGVTITTNDAAGDIGYDNTADFWSAGGTRATATAYSSTFTLAYPTNRVGIRVRGGYGRTVRVHAFSVSAQAATNASAVNVGVGTTAPTSNFQLAAGSTFDLGTAKAQWTDTGITAATMKASGVTVNCAVTGPDANGYYTFTVPSGWTTGASFVYLPSSMVNGATYQVSITMRSSFATAPVIIVSDGTSKNYLSSTTLTGTATTYTSSAVASTSTQLQIYLVNPAANMSVQFKDLSIARLDTSLSGNVGVGTTNPDSKLTIVGTSASPAASSLTLAKEWKAQQVIYSQGSAYALKLGSHYLIGTGAYASVQSSEFYDGTEHPGPLSLNPLGGAVGIGRTNPYQFSALDVAGEMRVGNPGATSYIIHLGTTGVGSIRSAYIYGDGTNMQINNQQVGALSLATNNTDRMVINSAGFVGIGTANPLAPFHVYSITTSNTPAIGMGGGYYFNSGTASLGVWPSGWGFGLSIIGRGSIACGDSFVAASDERIKKNIEPIQGALDKIRRLDIVSYDRIDYRSKSVGAGVLASNVRSVLPKAVHETRETIPNIYLPATHLKIRSVVLIEVKCDDKDIKEGSKVKLMIMQGEKEVEHISKMTNWTGASFEVEEWKEYSEDDKVFAYGVEVDDFLNVDKEQIGILAAGAVKELVQIVEDLTAKSDAQSREISELKRLVGSLLR